MGRVTVLVNFTHTRVTWEEGTSIKEVQELKKNPHKKSYSSFSEILAEMEEDDEV